MLSITEYEKSDDFEFMSNSLKCGGDYMAMHQMPISNGFNAVLNNEKKKLYMLVVGLM